MTCVECKKHAPVYARKWSARDDGRLVRMGWFIWNERAPVEIHGCVLCPGCQRKRPDLVAKAGPCRGNFQPGPYSDTGRST